MTSSNGIDPNAPNAQRPHTTDRGDDVGCGERFVDEVQAELVVQMVVKPSPDTAGPTGQRDAQPGVLA
jgi:hypothetical protein